MALNCAMSLNVTAYSVGQTPPPMATLTVYNPNASAVVVTSMQVTATQFGNTSQTLPIQQSVPPTGPGQNTTVPAGGSINIGPFPIVLASAAYVAGANPTVAQPASAEFPNNPQVSQRSRYIAVIGALVYGSDGSANVAAPVGMTVSHGFPPPIGTQGGFLNFSSPQNFANLLMGVL